MNPSDLPPGVVADISFIGRGGGQVKALGGFRKGHHTLPDAANDTTNGFLAKICAGELGGEAEALFQGARTALGYKRRELALETTGGTALLTAKDFTVEITYALEPAEPTRYAVTTTLRGLRDTGLARTPEFEGLFGGRFSEISFFLRKGARVEDVIDLIEGLDTAAGLQVEYPSDCRECVIRVEGVDAVVRCTGQSLEMVFPRAGSPAALIDGFLAVRHAFSVSKPLAGLLG
jgi:hypothetical protein